MQLSNVWSAIQQNRALLLFLKINNRMNSTASKPALLQVLKGIFPYKQRKFVLSLQQLLICSSSTALHFLSKTLFLAKLQTY